VDINNVGNNDTIGTIDSFGLPGNWLIRADTGGAASPTPTATGSPTPVQIMLRAHERRVGPNTELVELRWIGANSARVDIFRNGAQIARVQNTGSYAELLSRSGVYTYKVCEAATMNCSNEVRVRFGP